MVGEDAGGGGGAAGGGGVVRGVEDHHAVASALGEERGRLGGVFVGVDRVFERGHRPQAHAGVPVDRDELAQAVGLGGDEFDFETLGHGEAAPLFLGRPCAGVHEIVGAPAGRGGGRGG